ncbi:hypothetical protein MMC30_009251 [Trapelia coarctata]|nr:hypothetical protein [Trapelia coarctata]
MMIAGPSRWTSVTRKWLSKAQAQPSSSLSNLIPELKSRRLALLQDDPTPLSSYLLSVTLEDFLPSCKIPLPSTLPPGYPFATAIPPAHHLVYFPPSSRLSALLPDGTDPEQSPGEPFVRRMWAGGRINFRPSETPSIKMVGARARCLERISDVIIKGTPGNEKMFVTIERRISRVFRNVHKSHLRIKSTPMLDDAVREVLMQDKNCSIIEHRDLVFMRERTPETAADAANAPSKIVRPPHEPTFSHVLTPTAALLFRFSALTFNAHRIHLDKQYCREVEGHRNLLVHGPLSLVLMVEVLQRHLSTLGLLEYKGRAVCAREQIAAIEYRNLAPLYADEEMRVCGREKENGVWDVWIEGKDGGYAVKGTAQTRHPPPVKEKDSQGTFYRRNFTNPDKHSP